MKQSSVACRLDAVGLDERRALLPRLAGRVLERRVLPDGIALRYRADSLAGLARLIELERRCCPFLRFRLTVEPDDGDVWLELTGPEGTRDFVRTLL